MLGSARVPRVGFGVAPKQAFSNASWRLVFSQPKKVRDRENALASTRDARAPLEANRLRGCPLRPE